MQFEPLSTRSIAELTDLWNAALGTRFPMRMQLLERNLFGDLNYLPEASFAAVVDGRLVGMVGAKLNREFIGAIAPRQGYINSLIVHPDYQRQGIGTALLNRAVAQLRQLQPTKIHVGRDTFHFFPGVPTDCPEAEAFFQHHRAIVGDGLQTDLLGDLSSFDLPAGAVKALEQPGVEVRPLKPEEVAGMADFFRRSFPGRWQFEFAKYIYDGGDPGDLIAVVVDGTVEGFCHIYTPESRWIGPGVYWAPLYPEHRFGGAGPLGVSKEVRGRGLGLAVVAVGIDELKRRGITRAAIDWTDLIEFYGLLGFKPWKQYRPAELPLA